MMAVQLTSLYSELLPNASSHTEVYEKAMITLGEGD